MVRNGFAGRARVPLANEVFAEAMDGAIDRFSNDQLNRNPGDVVDRIARIFVKPGRLRPSPPEAE